MDTKGFTTEKCNICFPCMTAFSFIFLLDVLLIKKNLFILNTEMLNNASLLMCTDKDRSNQNFNVQHQLKLT